MTGEPRVTQEGKSLSRNGMIVVGLGALVVVMVGLFVVLSNGGQDDASELDEAVRSLSLTASAAQLSETLRGSTELAEKGKFAKAETMAEDVAANASDLSARAAEGEIIPSSLPSTIRSLARSAREMKEVAGLLSRTDKVIASSDGKLAALKSERASLRVIEKQALSATRLLDRAMDSLGEALEAQRLALTESDALEADQEDTIRAAERALGSESSSATESITKAVRDLRRRANRGLQAGPLVSGPYYCGIIPGSRTTAIVNEGSISCEEAFRIAADSSGPNEATGPTGWDCSGFAKDVGGLDIVGAAGYACSGPNSVRISFIVEQAIPEPEGLEAFQTPSGNIACSISSGQARCDIAEKDWTAPEPAGCDYDSGGGLVVASEPGEVVCANDTVRSPGLPTLEYGSTSQIGAFRCESSESGVRCENTETGGGFFISVSRYELF